MSDDKVSMAVNAVMKFDADGNSTLDRNELSKYLDQVSNQLGKPIWPDDKKEAMFNKMDKNKDGVISIEEVKLAVKETLGIK